MTKVSEKIKRQYQQEEQKYRESMGLKRYSGLTSSLVSEPTLESAPAKPKYEYSTDNLSMVDLSGGAVTGVVDMTDNLVNPVVESASDIADYIKSSNAYKKYLYTDEEKKLEAKNISIETGIPVNALLMSDENMATGRSVQEYKRKNMAFALDGDGFDMSGVYEKFPGLQAIVENPNMSDNDLAIAMHNIEDLTKARTAAEAFSLGLDADQANYRIGEIGMIGLLGGEITSEGLSEIEQLRKFSQNQKAKPSFFDDPLVSIAGGVGANIYHMERGARRGAQFAATALAAGVGVSVASGGTATAVAMPVALAAAGKGVRYGMAYDMFMNSAGRYYVEYSEMKTNTGEPLLTKSDARVFAVVAAGIETAVEFLNYDQIMKLLGAGYKHEIKEIIAKAGGDQGMIKAGLAEFLRTRGAQAVKVGMTETVEEAVQDVGDKAVHNAIVTYAPNAAERKYSGVEFVKGALEASAEALPGIIGLSALGGAASNIKSVRDFARLQKEKNDIFFSEMKLENGLAMIKNLQENMKGSKLFKKSPEIYQAVVKGAVENTEFKEVRIDTELALQDEEGAQVFNQLVETMGLEQEEVKAIIENKADLVVPTEIYTQTVMGNDKFDQYISFDEQGHSVARKKYYMAVAEDMMKKINIEQEEKQAELIDSIITTNFPDAGIEQDLGAAIILTNPSNPKQAWAQLKEDVTNSINARLGGIVKKLEEGMSRGVHHYYSEESGHEVKRMSDNDAWYDDFYKQHNRRPNKTEILEMAREIYKGGGDKYGMPEYAFEATEDMQEDFESLDSEFEEMYAMEDIKGKIDDLTASEMAVVRSLTPSGYKVYQQARKQFESGNEDLQKAGRMNAILLARYADRMADNLSKITGKPYTAEDYMRERLHIVADAQNTDAQGYGQPITNLDLDLDREVDVLDLDTMSNALKGKSPKEVLAYIKEISDGVQVPTADFKAMVGLPKNIDAYGQKHIVFSKSNQQRKNIVARNKVLTNFFKVIFATRVVEVSPNKKIKEENLTKTQKRKNEVERFYRLFVPVKMNGHLYTLLLTAEDFNKSVEFDAQEVSLYEISAKKIEDNRPSATLNVQGTLPSTLSIREVLQGVKDVDGNPYINSDGSGNFAVYNQPAYHGSPHEFDKFDLGAIGSGEGAQAHGWGLYFAQDRKVSERYREKLARKNRNKGVILYDGKEDAEVSNAMRYYGSAGLYSALSKESRDEVKAKKEISNILVGMQNDIERWDKQVKFYQKYIDRIKENPKLSITAFLKEAPKEDVSKLKDIVDDARSFARMRGQRTNIKGVLDRLQAKQEMPLNEKDFLTRYANILENLDVDKLEVDISTGSLLEVDIPENDVLLDEDKPLSEQPEKVRQAIQEYYRQRPENYNVPKSENDLGVEIGKQFYKDVVFQMYKEGHKESPERAASELLNKLGIKGITYEGYRDGRCYVVFDDKAISIIERYNQSVRGQTKIGGMSRVVSLFESADKSTFVHELGHVALADLKMLAEMDDAPQQLVRDWQTVKEWIGYKDSQGFTREQHEKFARGFEAYLRTGKAPVRGLKAVFRTFKKWLCDIYADFMQLGGKPSPEIQAVMARMLASEQEIEAEAKVQNIESITRNKGMEILDDTTRAMYERWVYEAKEEAKEKVMKVAMQDISDQFAEQRQAIIESMREDIENELKEKDIFRTEECVRLSGSTDILFTLGYTEESYRKELEANGGGLQKAVEEKLAKAVADLDSNKVSDEQIRIEAEKTLSASKYKAMLLMLEYESLSRKEAAESRLDKSVSKALEDIEKDLRKDTAEPKQEGAEVKSLKQKIADLKYAYRWREAEMRLIERMQKAEAKKEKEKAVTELKKMIAESKAGIRLVRDAIEGKTSIYRSAAAMQIMNMPIRQGTAVASWRQKERMKGAEVTRLMAEGKWAKAKQAKLEQVMFSYFADESLQLKEDVEKKVNRLKKRSNSIAKGNVKLAVDERYFYDHLLYVFGINRRDAPVPQEWDETKSIEDMFRRYKYGCEIFFMDEDGNIEIPSFIKAAASGNEVYKTKIDIGREKPVAALGYGALTKSEWDGLYEILTRVYTIGRNTDRLYTVVDEKGNEVSFEDAVARIVDGIDKNVRIKKTEDTTGATEPTMIERQVTAAGDLSSELVKPETIFLRNDGDKDGVSMMFLYGPIKRAADKELKMKTKTTKVVKKLFSEHGMKNWHKKRYKFGTSNVTKEQIIVLALNWGTEINRKRVLDGYHVTEQEVTDTLSNLDADDWKLVVALWKHIGSFWEETVAIEERMTGVTLKKQQATPFDITDQEGNVHHIAGGYYPIMYDPKKSIKAADQENNDLAKKQMSSNMVLGTNRSHTKARSQGTVERQVYTTLEPLSIAIDNMIHNICYREAVRDVNKLVNNKEVVKAMQAAHGLKVVRDIQKWARDNWAMDEKKDAFSRVLSFLRRNMTMAVMAYRTSTALLGITNLTPMMAYLGKGRTLAALINFYKNPLKNWEDCKSRSVFLAERAQTIDRDVREKLTKRTAYGKASGWLEDHAFWLMALIDLLSAAPLWKSEYTRVWQEKSAKGLAPELIEQQAVAAGDAAVRRVMGSGDVKDLSPAQRGSEVAKSFTMYYSYMNTVFNALALKGMIANDRRSREAWMNFMQSVLFWVVLQCALEQVVRAIWSGDDDDYSERVKERLSKEKFAQALGEQVVGMFPVARDGFKAVVDVIVDGRTSTSAYTSAYDSIARATKTVQVLRSKKSDWIDIGRETTKTANAFTGWSDTLTDGLWTLLRYAESDFDYEIGDVLKAVIFDKKLKK